MSIEFIVAIAALVWLMGNLVSRDTGSGSTGNPPLVRKR